MAAPVESSAPETAPSPDVTAIPEIRIDEPAAASADPLTVEPAPGTTALRLVSRFAGPVARFGHDWVLDSGARQFIARAVAPVVGD